MGQGKRPTTWDKVNDPERILSFINQQNQGFIWHTCIITQSCNQTFCEMM